MMGRSRPRIGMTRRMIAAAKIMEETATNAKNAARMVAMAAAVTVINAINAVRMVAMAAAVMVTNATSAAKMDAMVDAVETETNATNAVRMGATADVVEEMVVATMITVEDAVAEEMAEDVEVTVEEVTVEVVVAGVDDHKIIDLHLFRNKNSRHYAGFFVEIQLQENLLGAAHNPAIN